MKDATIVLRIEPRLKERLKLVAKAQEMSLAEVCRAAFEDYVAPDVGFSVPIVGTLSGEGIRLAREEVKSS